MENNLAKIISIIIGIFSIIGGIAAVVVYIINFNVNIANMKSDIASLQQSKAVQFRMIKELRDKLDDKNNDDE